ncbi:hypothetical protein BMS3Bbin04_00591 [bacterium BMS3Bbin04]|nr:hypothetical protein BMS3Bbin04_00591 [bacterium BMS3Bbin04]
MQVFDNSQVLDHLEHTNPIPLFAIDPVRGETHRVSFTGSGFIGALTGINLRTIDKRKQRRISHIDIA